MRISTDAATFSSADINEFVREAARRRKQVEETELPPPFYRIALGLEPVQLGDVEFRILLFLASSPYYPFSRLLPVTDETVDKHIASLREQLSFFRDYVQTVPYVGYRFKA